MGGILLPKVRLTTESPVIFLAGPIKGAPNWQSEAAEYILNKNENTIVATPRLNLENELAHYFLPGDGPRFNMQLDWERHYLEHASKSGAILFWLPNRVEETRNRTYARDTRGELGEWRGRKLHEPNLNIVIGAQPEFDGLDIIKRNYCAIIPDMKFYETLESTCDAALELIRNK